MQSTASFALEGGMDLTTPAIKMPPGRVIASLNYEPVSSGYQRLRGYERFDGRSAPSAAIYYRQSVSGASGWTVAVGGSITINSISRVLLYKDHPTAPTVIIYWNVTTSSGASNGAAITGTGGTGGTTSSVASADASVTDLSGTSYEALKFAAAAQQRALVAVIPGSGPVRGVWSDGTYIYGARDNAGATAGAIYYASITGWLAFSLGSYVSFTSGGTYELQENDIIDDGPNSIGVRRIVKLSGEWADGDAAGYFYTETTALTAFTTGETLNVGANMNVLTVGATVGGNTLPVGGRYEFLRHNFFGATNRTRSYLANGVSQAFEQIVTAGNHRLIAPIFTGMPVDKPTKIAEHRESLFLAFPGGSVQYSQVGEPVAFNAILGAGEIGIGCEITDYVSATEGVLTILGEQKIAVLYGNDSSDYQLETLTDQAGAVEHTAQRLGTVIYLDNGGVRSISSSARFGNFTFGTISRLIAPLLEDYRRDGVNPTASLVWRIKDQYWLFFDNGTAIVIYFGKKNPEILPVNLGITVSCASSFEMDGVERAFVGTSTGYVMELDKGTSFDGAVIEHYFRLPFNHFGSPDYDKRVFEAHLDLEASGPTSLSVSVDFDYGSVVGLEPQAVSITTGGGALDHLGSNELYYASQIETTAQVYIDGVARNFSLKLSGSTSTEQPHIATGVTYHLAQQRLVR